MKLILTSAGFTTDAIIKQCVDMVGKPKADIRVAIVNEAYAVEHGDHSWVMVNLDEAYDNFGSVELVNLLALDPQKIKERIMLADVLFVIGGHTDYLMNVCAKSGFAEMLPEVLASKVYVGSSAGSMILGHRASNGMSEKIYGEAAEFGVTDYLKLVDLSLVPHHLSRQFPKNNPATLDKYADSADVPLYGMHDDSAVVIDGEAQTVIGTAPYITST